MTARNIALLDLSGKVPLSQLQKVAAALERQASSDFAEQWNITAKVVATDAQSGIPKGYWPIYIKNELELANAYGFHWLTEGNVPYADILYRPNWTITASHEMLEMLVNPYLDKFQVTDVSAEFEGDERFLVEVAGPVQSLAFGYFVDDILVSNFFYPSYFDLIKITGKKYDHLGVIEEPRSVLEGGYISFLDNLGQWWQTFVIQNKVDLRRLGEGADPEGQTSDRLFRIGVLTVCSAAILFITFKLINHVRHSK